MYPFISLDSVHTRAGASSGEPYEEEYIKQINQHQERIKRWIATQYIALLPIGLLQY